MAITSFDRPATLPSASSIPDRTTSRWRRLFSTRSGTTLPGASSRAAQASSPVPSFVMRPANTLSAEISHASFGFAVFAVGLIPEYAFRDTSINQKPSRAELQYLKGNRSSEQWPVVGGQQNVRRVLTTDHEPLLLISSLR